MPGPNGERCDRCYFGRRWYEGATGDDELECLRYPPTVAPDPDDDPYDAYQFVDVMVTDWCGEFKPKSA